MAAKDSFQSLAQLSRRLVFALKIYAALLVASIAATASFIAVLADMLRLPDPEAAYFESDIPPAEYLQLAAILLVLVATIVTAVMFFRWTYRAAWNVRHLGARGLTVSPGMAVGWYFVPFANLVMPFRAMKEIWLASESPDGWKPGPVGLLAMWWALWLVGSVANHVAGRMIGDAETVRQAMISEYVSIFGDVLSLLTCWALVRLIGGVQAAQDRSESRLGMPPAFPAEPLPEPAA